MNIFIVLLLAFVIALPLLLWVASVVCNLRMDAGRFGQHRRALGRGFWPRAVLGALNGISALVLIGLTYPLGLLPRRQGGGQGPPVILVHGLYHNSSGWLAFARLLTRAGFANQYRYGYCSFTRAYPDLVFGLTRLMEQALKENPGHRLSLVGHSLGGLVIRGAIADDRFAGKIGAVVTLGTPHRGSELAILGIGALARSLRPASPVFASLAAQRPVAGAALLSLFTPLDNMVFPVRCLEVDEPGWVQEARLPDVSHVGLIYDRGFAERAIDHLEQARRSGLLGPG